MSTSPIIGPKDMEVQDCIFCNGYGQIHDSYYDMRVDCEQCYGTGENYDDLFRLGIELGNVIPPVDGGVTCHNVELLTFSNCDICKAPQADRNLERWIPLGYGGFYCKDCVQRHKAENPPKFGGAW